MKKLFFDFFPIVIFFIVFKIHGIYYATGALMIASAIQISYELIRYRKVEMMHIITLVLVLVFGGMTIYFHDDRFIQWKVSIINWLFALILLASHFFMKKPIIRMIMEKNIELPDLVWQRLNFIWITYFTILGAVNIYVAYNYSLNAWVNFKTFGLIGFTLIFIIGQSVYLYKHMDEAKK
jgi:intracellular septation protein